MTPPSPKDEILPKTPPKRIFHEATSLGTPLRAQGKGKHPHATPRSRRGERQQTDASTEIGEAMSSEFVECTVEDFQKEYTPFVVEHVQPYLKTVLEKHSDWLATRPDGTENPSFAELEGLSRTIGALSIPTRNNMDRFIRMTPHDALYSTTKGCNHKIDACMIKTKAEKESPTMTNILVPFEFKLKRDYTTVRQNRLQIISACVHLLQDDVRRMFTYAITIESDRMTLWYISRSHSAKSQSFSYIERPEILVSVLISLMFATEQELGYDPHIHLRPDNRWVYEFHRTENDKEKPRFFLTIESVLESRILCVSGRTTRIFKAFEIDTKDSEPKENASPVIVKDVWLDEEALTERAIQSKLFDDINTFASQADWKSDPRLAKGFANDVAIVGELEELFKDNKYRELFLCVEDESTGLPSKSVPRSAGRPRRPVFFKKSSAQATSEPCHSSRMPSMATSKKDHQSEPAPAPVHERRDFAPKRRSFILFKDVCETVHHLPTMFDAISVLSQCLTALRIMFCAGWVHRDISVGNVMANRDLATDQWKVKLGDLEYAKRFPSDSPGSSDPKTGTPFFMPCEVLNQDYFGVEPVPVFDAFQDDHDILGEAAALQSVDSPVQHNFLHDMESLYWICLWLITARVNCRESEKYANKIFRKTMDLSPPRRRAFASNITTPLSGRIIPQLALVVEQLDKLRATLYDSARALGNAKGWHDLQVYSRIHRGAFSVLQILLESPGDWRGVCLQARPLNASVPRTQPARAKRRRADDDDYHDNGNSDGDNDEDDEDDPPAAKARKVAPGNVRSNDKNL